MEGGQKEEEENEKCACIKGIKKGHSRRVVTF